MQYTVCKKQFLLNSKTFVVFLSENSLNFFKKYRFSTWKYGIKTNEVKNS